MARRSGCSSAPRRPIVPIALIIPCVAAGGDARWRDTSMMRRRNVLACLLRQVKAPVREMSAALVLERGRMP
jgi:hypothetical protein